METATGKPFNRFDIPVKFGIATGLIMAVLSTIQYMFFTESYGSMMIFVALTFLAAMVMYYITGAQQRKAMGGFIDMRQAFSSIFIAIIISLAISYVYNLIYIKFIDPDVIDRISNVSITFAEKMGAPQEKLDEIAEQIEQQKAEGQGVGKQILSFLQQVVIYSIFGFICAAIVKKRRPQHLA
jgi:hypothetical protein